MEPGPRVCYISMVANRGNYIPSHLIFFFFLMSSVSSARSFNARSFNVTVGEDPSHLYFRVESCDGGPVTSPL